MNTTSTITEIPRRGRLKYGESQFSEGWPLVRDNGSEKNPWHFPGVDPKLDAWSDSMVIEPSVQGNSDVQRAFLEQCYSRGLDVTISRVEGLHNIDVWDVTCPNHFFDHEAHQHGHRRLEVWVSVPDASIDAVELVDPDQTDPALARVEIDLEDVAQWLDVIKNEVRV